MSANATQPRRALGWIGYDWFKLIVAIILLLLLLWLSFGARPVAPTLAAPTLASPAQAAELPAGMVTFAGTGTPGSQVQVAVDGAPVGTAAVGPDGRWTLESLVTAIGERAVAVTALDAAGQPAAGVAPLASRFTVAEAPATLAVIDTPTLGSPAQAAELPAGTVTFAGTGTPGTQVHVMVDGASAGTATVDPDGTWSLDADVMAAGEHTVTLTALDGGGRPAPGASPVEGRFTVAEAAAALPAIDSPRMSAPAMGAQVPAGTVTFAGTGTPGSQVQVAVDGAVVGTATVGADGSWSLDANVTTAGQRSVVIRALDASGQPVPGAMPGAASFTVAEAAATGGAASGGTSGTGGAASAAPAITSLASGASVAAGTLPIVGTGAPGSTVEVLDGDKVLGTATVGTDGTWTFDYPAAAGDHIFGARAAGDTGAPASTVAVTVTAAAAGSGTGSGTSGGAAGSGTGGSSVSAPPAILSLRNGATVAAGKVTISGTGAPGRTIEIVSGGQVLGTATVGADGAWTFDYDAAPGSYALDVREAGGSLTGTVVAITVVSPPAAGAGTASGTGTAAGSTGSGAGAAAGTGAAGPAQLPNTGGEEPYVLAVALGVALVTAGAGLRLARLRAR